MVIKTDVVREQMQLLNELFNNRTNRANMLSDYEKDTILSKYPSLIESLQGNINIAAIPDLVHCVYDYDKMTYNMNLHEIFGADMDTFSKSILKQIFEIITLVFNDIAELSLKLSYSDKSLAYINDYCKQIAYEYNNIMLSKYRYTTVDLFKAYLGVSNILPRLYLSNELVKIRQEVYNLRNKK